MINKAAINKPHNFLGQKLITKSLFSFLGQRCHVKTLKGQDKEAQLKKTKQIVYQIVTI